MSILVTGAKGTVGSYFAARRDEFSEPLELVDIEELDITDLAAVRAYFEKSKPSCVINLAAATNVDACETDVLPTYKLNAVGALNVAIGAREQSAQMVQVSTTQIFGGDGAKGPFSEMDQPAPPNLYAQTKLAGEQHVREQVQRAYIVRTAWIMGGGKKDKKFVGKVADRLLNNQPIKAVNDQYGSPTYARELVECIRRLLLTGAYGTYHATGKGSATRYDMAMVMKEVLGSSSEVEAVPASAFPLPAPRPVSDASESLALPARALGDVMSPWQEALKTYLLEEIIPAHRG